MPKYAEEMKNRRKKMEDSKDSNFVSIQEAMNLAENFAEKNLAENSNPKVHLRGWCYRERKSNVRAFVVLRDHSNIIQCIIEKEQIPEGKWDILKDVSIECALEVSGTIAKDSRAPTGYEIKVSDFSVISKAERFPITQDQSTEFLLDVRHLWLRSRQLTAVMKIKAGVLKAVREFFDRQGYFEVTPPIITGSSCEGGSTLFEIKYFGDKAYLSQSAQLYLESLIFSLEKVWALTPSFRAEASRTARHLAEYWHLEAEAAWLDFEGLLKLEEELISYVCQRTAELVPDELRFLGRNPDDLKKVALPFPKITYDEALKILEKDGVEIAWGEDLRTLEEEQLMKHYDKPLIITRYPKKIKAFYMKEDAENPDVVLCCDVIAPESYGEIIGSSERENDYEKIITRLKEAGEDIKNYDWYLDLRKYGGVQHSGFGMGVERIVRWFCRLENIRDTIPYPRTISRKYP